MKMNLSPRACGAVRVFNLVSYAYEHARNRRLRPYLAEIVGVPAYIMLRNSMEKNNAKTNLHTQSGVLFDFSSSTFTQFFNTMVILCLQSLT